MRGGQACIPMLPRQGLSKALIDPAIATLQARGADIRFNSRIAELTLESSRVTGIRGPDGQTSLGSGDAVVLAVPPWAAAGLLPGLVVPEDFQAILNIHFRLDADGDRPHRAAAFVGLTSGTAEWVFVKPDHVSVTISAANTRVDDPVQTIASAVWPNVVDGLGLPANLKDQMPLYRVVKEKRATFSATAPQEARRPPTRTEHATNLALAGDWTATGLPAHDRGRHKVRPFRRESVVGALKDAMALDAVTAPVVDDAALLSAQTRAADALTRRQRKDGHFVFELEADATIPAEYVLLEHFLARIDPDLEAKIGVYLRGIQGTHGGWPLFHDGAFNISASVKAYFALKAIGDDPDAPHMRRAREAILAAGGAERTNVFTRAQLALFGAVPWRAVPVMPLEIMHLPLWFPFHLSKVSYWSRTVIVPLMVLMALRPKARNPRGIGIPELFRTPPSR